MLFCGEFRKQRFHLVVILDAGGVFDAARYVDEFGVELFADCGDIFRIDAAGEPERGSVCFFAEERFGDGLAGAAGDAFDFGVQQNAGFAVFAETCNVIEVFGGAYAGCAVVGEGCAARFRECVGIVRINAVELYGVEYAFLGERGIVRRRVRLLGRA